jgi:ribosomal protein L11 methyltransferase
MLDADAELVADLLWTLGATAVAEEHDGEEIVLVTSFADRSATDRAVADLQARGHPVAVHDVAEADYLDAWKPFAAPVRVGEAFVIRAPWVPFDARPDQRVVEIDPGRAFGSGAHATTRLMLMRLVEQVPATVLDVGCGSGVLAVVAARLGATRVVAVDIDPAAVEATAVNAARNSVSVDVRDEPLAALDGPYELVLANLLAPVLVALATDLVRLVAPAGRLIVGGVLVGRWAHVAAALHPLRIERIDEFDGWAVLTLTR